MAVNPDWSPDEMAALVDRSGRVVGAAPRAEMRRDNLLHAATAVIVRNSSGEVYVHRRALTKDWAPGHHDCCAGGVIRPGEDPEPSARRELAEELGITGQVTLRSLGANLYEDDETRCREHAYEVTWDGPISHPDSEVLSGEWMTLAALGSALRDPDWPFVPDTRQLLERLAGEGVGDYALLWG